MPGNKKTRSIKYFLEDIIESVQKVRNYASRGKSSFFKDEILQDAIIRRLEIIGEASNQLPEEIIERYSEIPWKQIIGFRNVAIHSANLPGKFHKDPADRILVAIARRYDIPIVSRDRAAPGFA